MERLVLHSLLLNNCKTEQATWSKTTILQITESPTHFTGLDQSEYLKCQLPAQISVFYYPSFKSSQLVE
jgi:hypothetical protein